MHKNTITIENDNVIVSGYDISSSPPILVFSWKFTKNDFCNTFSDCPSINAIEMLSYEPHRGVFIERLNGKDIFYKNQYESDIFVYLSTNIGIIAETAKTRYNNYISLLNL